MADPYMGMRLELPARATRRQDAGPWRRLASFLADLLLLDLAVFSAFAPLALPFSAILGSLPRSLLAAGAAMSMLALAYFALFEYLLGQTPGMMLLGLRAENVTLWRAIVRSAYLIPLFPFPLLWIIEPLHLLWRGRRLLELLTGTRTIEVR